MHTAIPSVTHDASATAIGIAEGAKNGMNSMNGMSFLSGAVPVAVPVPMPRPSSFLGNSHNVQPSTSTVDHQSAAFSQNKPAGPPIRTNQTKVNKLAAINAVAGTFQGHRPSSSLSSSFSSSSSALYAAPGLAVDPAAVSSLSSFSSSASSYSNNTRPKTRPSSGQSQQQQQQQQGSLNHWLSPRGR